MLNGIIFKQALISGANNIVNHRQEVDALNVFPVPDGDTGTNMSMTISAAARELQVCEQTDIASVSAKAAAALLRGARGNSGVILSLIFRGISNGFKGMDSADGRTLAKALELGKESAYKAVMKPTEGTILTVIRMAAEAVKNTQETDCKIVLKTAYEAAKDALLKTPEMLPVLKQAGVVDAGGQGFIFILEGMLSVIEDGKTVEPIEALDKKDNAKSEKITAVSINVTTVSTLDGIASTILSTGTWINLVSTTVNAPQTSVELKQICPWKLNFLSL